MGVINSTADGNGGWICKGGLPHTLICEFQQFINVAMNLQIQSTNKEKEMVHVGFNTI